MEDLQHTFNNLLESVKRRTDAAILATTPTDTPEDVKTILQDLKTIVTLLIQFCEDVGVNDSSKEDIKLLAYQLVDQAFYRKPNVVLLSETINRILHLVESLNKLAPSFLDDDEEETMSLASEATYNSVDSNSAQTDDSSSTSSKRKPKKPKAPLGISVLDPVESAMVQRWGSVRRNARSEKTRLSVLPTSNDTIPKKLVFRKNKEAREIIEEGPGIRQKKKELLEAVTVRKQTFVPQIFVQRQIDDVPVNVVRTRNSKYVPPPDEFLEFFISDTILKVQGGKEEGLLDKMDLRTDKVFTLYCVHVRTNMPEYGFSPDQKEPLIHFVVHRRYQAFFDLYQTLLPIAPGSLPPLPPKAIFGRFDPSFVESRRSQLERILQAAGKHRALQKHPLLRSFCSSERIAVHSWEVDDNEIDTAPSISEAFVPDADQTPDLATFFTPLSYFDNEQKTPLVSEQERASSIFTTVPSVASPPRPSIAELGISEEWTTGASNSLTTMATSGTGSGGVVTTLVVVKEEDKEVMILESFEGRYRVRSSDINHLLQHFLSEEREAGEEFVSAFLLGFRHIITPLELMMRLFQFFNVVAPEDADEELSSFVSEFRPIIQRRTTKFLLRWTSRAPFDFGSEEMRKALQDYIQFSTLQGNAALILSNELTGLQGFLDGRVVKNDPASDYFGLRRISLPFLSVLSGSAPSSPMASSISSSPRNFFETSTTETRDWAALLQIIESALLNNGSPSPMPIVSHGRLDSNSLLQFEPLEIARQMTRVDHEMFEAIEPEEFLVKLWGLGEESTETELLVEDIARHLIACVDRFNLTSYWVAGSICAEMDLQKRTNILNHFINIAKNCRALNNFTSLMAILAAVNLSSVQRLRRTWQNLPDRSIDILHQLETQMSADGNYAAYRSTLKRIVRTSPCVPYLGLYLKDLIFINDGNPRTLPSGQINFRKIWLIYDTLREISSFKRFRRSETLRNPQLYELVKSGIPEPFDDDTIYQDSLRAEPRQQS